MIPLTLSCLGRFAVQVGQQPVLAFRTDKVRALLVYLALEPRPHRRETLAALLWPDIGEEHAQNNLRSTLHRLRQPLQAIAPELTEQFINSTRQSIGLDATHLRCDVQQFTTLVNASAAHARSAAAIDDAHLAQCADCRARLIAAAELYEGELLAGFTLVDAPAFEEWLLLRREALHQQMVLLLFALAAAHTARAEWESAQPYVRRLLALEPWREEGHRLLMQILARSGQRSAALAQYQQCRQVLQAELGVEPDTETTALYEQIRSETFAPALVAPTAQPPLVAQPLQPLPTPPHNLPAALTPLIGRTQALAEVTTYVQRQRVRLLTLVGPGGMGKTRLALEIGRTLLLDFADGVFFVPLVAITSATELVTAIATEIGLRPEGNDPLHILQQALRPKQMLLILDNFEHLLVRGEETVAPVVAILAAAPQVQIIVTSRERLKLRGEQLYPVPALAFAAHATLVEAAALPAVNLFVQSAQQVQADFQLTTANLAAVLRICQLVQGMPLGLELATAYVGTLPLAAIVAEIERSVEFLAVDWRDMPERQRSMRAIFEWSWQLLDQQEREAFCQLALFQGGCTRVAAEAITGATLAVLTRLVHKSLLQWQEGGDAEGRYTIHELLRQFATAKVASDQARQAVAKRHSDYYLALAARQMQQILHAAPNEAVQTLQREIDNIRQAWRWGVGGADCALVEACALALREYYWLTGLRVEGIEMFTLAIQARQTQRLALPAAHDANPEADKQQQEAQLCSLLFCFSAHFHMLMSRHEDAFRLASAGVQLAQSSGSARGLAFSLLLQGQALRRQGQSTAAYDLLTQAAQIAASARGDQTQSVALLVDVEQRAYSWLCSIALSDAAYAQARSYVAAQLDLCQRFQKTVAHCLALTSLCDIHRELGDYQHVHRHAEEALVIARNVNFHAGQAICYENLAVSAWAQGEWGEALQLYQQLLVIYQEPVQPLERASALQMLARLYSRMGADHRAQQAIDDAFRLLAELASPAHETLIATWTRVWLGYQSGALTQALADAEQSLVMARQYYGGAHQAYALFLLGLLYESHQQATAARSAYEEALALYLTLSLPLFAVEPRAGIARLAQAAGDLMGALVAVEEILLILQQQPRAGFDEPFQLYWTCYTVLAANHDPRAITLLQTAKDLLAAYAQRIPDPALRHSFLTNVAVHHALWQAAHAASAPAPALEPTIERQRVHSN